MNEITRTCKTCGEIKHIDQFEPNRWSCLRCRGEYKHNYHKKTYIAKGRHVGCSRTYPDEDITSDTSIGRTCCDCKIWKPASEYWNVKKTGNLFAYCKPCGNVRMHQKYENNKKKNPEFLAVLRVQGAESKARRKLDVIKGYGGKCACCGENKMEFLTLDHINNDGAEHRRKTGIRTGGQTWAYARREGYPSIFQLLCWNCNSSKGAWGYCPHEFEK